MQRGKATTELASRGSSASASAMPKQARSAALKRRCSHGVYTASRYEIPDPRAAGASMRSCDQGASHGSGELTVHAGSPPDIPTECQPLAAARSRSRSDTTPWCHSLRSRRFATPVPTLNGDGSPSRSDKSVVFGRSNTTQACERLYEGLAFSHLISIPARLVKRRARRMCIPFFLL